MTLLKIISVLITLSLFPAYAERPLEVRVEGYQSTTNDLEKFISQVEDKVFSNLQAQKYQTTVFIPKDMAPVLVAYFKNKGVCHLDYCADIAISSQESLIWEVQVSFDGLAISTIEKARADKILKDDKNRIARENRHTATATVFAVLAIAFIMTVGASLRKP